jgi:predicted DNA binding protein
MQVIDAKLRVRHSSTMCNVSMDFPNAQMLLWCNGQTDVLQISAHEPDDLEDTLEALHKVAALQELGREKGSAITMFRECACDGCHLPGIAEKNGCLAIGPQTYSEGWEMLRLFAPSQAALKECIAQIKEHGEVEIVSMKPRNESTALKEMGIAPLPVFGGLTDKQIDVLVSAYESGLLSVPARTRMEVVAKRVGLSRSTYGEHLRKACRPWWRTPTRC